MGFVLFHQLSLFAWAVWVGSLPAGCCWHHARNERPCEDQARLWARSLRVVGVVEVVAETAALAAYIAAARAAAVVALQDIAEVARLKALMIELP